MGRWVVMGWVGGVRRAALAGLVLALGVPAVASAATFTVDASDGTPDVVGVACGTDGAAGGDCNTIQRGVEQAGPGDFVDVKPGSYPESVLVENNGVIVRGPKAGSPGRSRPAAPVASVEAIVTPPAGLAGFSIDGNGVTVDGFALKGALGVFGAVAVRGNILGEARSGNGAVVRNNIIRDSSMGISLAGDDHLIRDNAFYDNNAPGTGIGSGHGIFSVEQTSGVQIRSNLFVNHVGTGTTGSAIWSEDPAIGAPATFDTFATGMQIVANEIQGGDYALHALNLKNSNIESNTITGTGLSSIYFGGGNDVDIQRNRIDGSAWRALYFAGTGDSAPRSQKIRVQGNLMSNSVLQSIWIAADAFVAGADGTPDIHHNRFVNSGYRPEDGPAGPASPPDIADVAIDNADGGAPGVSADHNFYGCNTGPPTTDDGPVGCDKVLGTVDASPWLVLTASASPTSLNVGGTSTISASFLRDSTGAMPAGGASFFPASPVGFTEAGPGTLSGASATTSGGVASVTDTAATAGSSVVTATAQAASSQATVTFNAPPPPPAGPTPPASTPPADTKAPVAKVSGSKRQRLGSSVLVKLKCVNEACVVRATGTVRVPKFGKYKAKTYKLALVKRSIPSGAERTIKLKLSGAARKRIKAALRAGKKVSVKLTFKVADKAGNTRTLKYTVALKR